MLSSANNEENANKIDNVIFSLQLKWLLWNEKDISAVFTVFQGLSQSFLVKECDATYSKKKTHSHY